MAALPSQSCAIWMDHGTGSVPVAGEERLVGVDFSLPQLRKRQAISSHVLLTRANRMAPPNCRSCWEEQSSIWPEGEERQSLVEYKSGLPKRSRIRTELAAGACRESWKSSSQPPSSLGFERALEVSQIGQSS